MTARAADLSGLARRLYRHQRGAGKLLQVYRPYICPFETVLEHVPEGAEVLDVGCGGGLFLGLAAGTRGLRAGLGFDANAGVIEIANGMAAAFDTLSFRCIDVGEPWPEGAFDVVSMIDVMHHIPPAVQPAILPMVAARLRPGGVFLYKDINGADRLRAAANRLHDLVLAQEWVRYLPRPRLRELAAAAGLAEEHHETINRLWYGHDFHVFRMIR